MFDALCPPDSARPRKRLCVILVSQNTPYHDEPRKVLRQFAQDTTYSTERVRFMYIFKERQSDFVSALTTGKNYCSLDFYFEFCCSNKAAIICHCFHNLCYSKSCFLTIPINIRSNLIFLKLLKKPLLFKCL
jgi:hypothetical protein